MVDHSETSRFIPPPFSFAFTGHLMTGMVKAAAIALLLWGLGLTGLIAETSAGTAILTASIVMIAIESGTTVVERFFVLRHRHPDPGSVAMTVIIALLPLPISFLTGLLVEATLSEALVTMAVTTVVYWIFLVALERPWVEGDTQADIRRKWEQTQEMTREQFRSE